MPITIELFNEFCKRMDCEHIKIQRGGDQPRLRDLNNDTVYIFESGAVSDGKHEHHEPPTDKWELLRLRERYWRTQLDREIEAFTKFKTAAIDGVILARTYANQSANSSAADELRAGKERVEALRAALQPVLDELEQSPEAIQKRKNEQAARERRAAIDKIEQDILTVTI